MKARKFMVVSGFLGAGKTTSMIAFAEYFNQKYGKAVIIVNDLGAKNLVDKEYTSSCGCAVVEITGDCICYQTEVLVDKIKRLSDVDHADFVMSDIPGCGIAALDHVYHKLNDAYRDDFELAPFIVIADPERLRTIMPEKADIHLPPEMEYLFRSQLAEADAVVLNKIDLLSDQETKRYVDFLRSFCPDTPVFAISAREKHNIGEVVDYVYSNKAKLKVVDIGYGGEEFMAAEGKLTWYNRRFYMVSSKDFDGNAFVDDFIESVRGKLRAADRNVPHLKVFATAEDGDIAKASLLGIDYRTEHDKKIRNHYDKLRVVVNARAACEAPVLEGLMNEAMEEVVGKYDGTSRVFFTECFGMMDEGRV